MKKLLELREQKNENDSDYEVEVEDAVYDELETDEWVYELNKNIVRAYVDTVGRKEAGLRPFSDAEEIFDLKILFKEHAKSEEIRTSILSRDQLDEILCNFDEEQMKKYRVVNKKYLREVGKITKNYLNEIKKLIK